MNWPEIFCVGIDSRSCSLEKIYRAIYYTRVLVHSRRIIWLDKSSFSPKSLLGLSGSSTAVFCVSFMAGCFLFIQQPVVHRNALLAAR